MARAAAVLGAAWAVAAMAAAATEAETAAAGTAAVAKEAEMAEAMEAEATAEAKVEYRRLHQHSNERRAAHKPQHSCRCDRCCPAL